MHSCGLVLNPPCSNRGTTLSQCIMMLSRGSATLSSHRALCRRWKDEIVAGPAVRNCVQQRDEIRRRFSGSRASSSGIDSYAGGVVSSGGLRAICGASGIDTGRNFGVRKDLYAECSRSRNFCAFATTQEGTRGPSQAGPSISDGGVIDTAPPRGTRDFPPEDMRLRTWLFNKFREVSRLFGFEEIDFPVLESEELYIRKAGEEITQQLYNFEDKGGRKVTLRPELTPSLARLVLQKGKSASLPLKWFAIGQCWRYERMTRGRRREHYQWNMDIIGVHGVEAEAELLSAIVTFFSGLGITSKDVGIKVSNRKVLQEVLGRSVIPENSFAAVCVIVDKIEKIPRAEVEKELAALGLPVEAVDTILKALTLRSLDALEELLGSENEAVVELKQLFALARGYGFEDWLQFDASVVRGLAYYTGTVFEAFDRSGTLRAICGGGRYDKLLSTFGGVDTPACGFGFGDAVIVELLKEKNLMPQLSHEVDDIVMPLEEKLRPQAASVAALLRAQGRKVDVVMGNKKMKWAFKHSERIQAKRMVMVGSTEWANGTVRVKDLSSREELDLSLEEL